MCTVLLPPGDNPIAVNKYHISYYIYHIPYIPFESSSFNWSHFSLCSESCLHFSLCMDLFCMRDDCVFLRSIKPYVFGACLSRSDRRTLLWRTRPPCIGNRNYFRARKKRTHIYRPRDKVTAQCTISNQTAPEQNILCHKYQESTTADMGTRWRSWLRHCATTRKVACSIPDGVTGISHWQSFRPHYDPEVDSASNRNEYQEYFLRGKGGRCVGLTTLPPSCPDCLEIWEPQPPGTLRAWPGL